MLPLLSALLITQASPATPPQPDIITQPQDVQPLPGDLDDVLVFNSNSPEVVQTEGILLSTFPGMGKAAPQAHLNQPLQGRFDLFAHHIAKATSPEDLKTLYLGLLLHNPESSPVTVYVLQAASYLSQPDAPFIQLPPFQNNAKGTIYAGPGDRVTNAILRGQRQLGWPIRLVIPPGKSRMLLNVPIPVREFTPPINGRSTLARLWSNGTIYAASLARFAPTNPQGQERPPTLMEWETLLQTGQLAGPRDKAPTVPGTPGTLIYGRVAGVARGSVWRTSVIKDLRLDIPKPGQAFSYVLSSVERGTFGTGQIQSAPMVVRYPDTAYAAHGNYGVQYSLKLPLYNASSHAQTVTVALQTPLKTDTPKGNLRFFSSPPSRVFFRGTVRVRYRTTQGATQTRYVHLVQNQGQQGEPLVQMTLPPQQIRLVEVDLIYPPDATPPQVLTVKTRTMP